MNARDELAEYHELMFRQGSILDRVANALNGPPGKLHMWSHHDLGEKAEALVAKLPRTITTAAELDALPKGSVVLDRRGLSLHRNYDGWGASSGTRGIEEDELTRDAFPATVLHEAEVTS